MSTLPEKPASVPLAESIDWRSKEITELLERALAEDLGAGLPAKASAKAGDLTTAAVLPKPITGLGRIRANQVVVVAGLPLVERLFELFDPKIDFRPRVEEGTEVNRGLLAEVRGDARALLRSERTALNFLGRLSGIATFTRRFVTRLQGTQARLRDTRKTTPGLRRLERYAVRVGGGTNHRFGLYAAVLIKENHAQLVGGVGEAVRRVRQKYGRGQLIQAEVRDETELREALDAGADGLLLDNMSIEQVRRAVHAVRGRALPGEPSGQAWLEASGGINLETVRAYAECGVDYISVGALTHSAPAADISFDLVPVGPLGA